MLTSAGSGNHAVRPKNGRLFPLILIPDHGISIFKINANKIFHKKCYTLSLRLLTGLMATSGQCCLKTILLSLP